MAIAASLGRASAICVDAVDQVRLPGTIVAEHDDDLRESTRCMNWGRGSDMWLVMRARDMDRSDLSCSRHTVKYEFCSFGVSVDCDSRGYALFLSCASIFIYTQVPGQ
jgi:hypothetical protein